MSDLIRREDAIKILSQRAEILRGEYGDLGGACSGALKIIKSLPSAETERKKGQWIEYPDCLEYEDAYSDDHIVCSVCGHVYNICDNCTEEFDFCPHCGADMRGE